MAKTVPVGFRLDGDKLDALKRLPEFKGLNMTETMVALVDKQLGTELAHAPRNHEVVQNPEALDFYEIISDPGTVFVRTDNLLPLILNESNEHAIAWRRQYAERALFIYINLYENTAGQHLLSEDNHYALHRLGRAVGAAKDASIAKHIIVFGLVSALRDRCPFYVGNGKECVVVPDVAHLEARIGYRFQASPDSLGIVSQYQTLAYGWARGFGVELDDVLCGHDLRSTDLTGRFFAISSVK